MGKIIYISGGARSGKSIFAEETCKDLSDKVAYIATSEIFDEEMKDRVKKHKAQRPDSWDTYEAYRDLDKIMESISRNNDTALLDCLTVMVNNLVFHSDIDIETASFDELDKLEKSIAEETSKLLSSARRLDINLVIVSNEIGMGIVPENKLSRIYRDIIGRSNQKCAAMSDEAYFVVSGIAVKIKENRYV